MSDFFETSTQEQKADITLDDSVSHVVWVVVCFFCLALAVLVPQWPSWNQPRSECNFDMIARNSQSACLYVQVICGRLPAQIGYAVLLIVERDGTIFACM